MSHNFRVVLAIAGFLLLVGSGGMLVIYGYCKYRTLNPEPIPVKKSYLNVHPNGRSGHSVEYTTMEHGVRQVHRDGAIVFDNLKWTYTGGCGIGVVFLLMACFAKSTEDHAIEKQKAQQTPNNPLADE